VWFCQEKARNEMKKWEYLTIENAYAISPKMLNEQGEQGWELVTIAQFSHTCVAFFKREKSEIITPN